MMATTGAIMHHTDKTRGTRDQLGVHGKGIGQELVPSSARSDGFSQASASGDDSSSEKSFDSSGVIGSVMQMNVALTEQIDTLRLRLDVESRHHQAEINKVKTDKNRVLSARDKEINDLKDSLVNRDTRIKYLARDSDAKDDQITDKLSELDELKRMVAQTEIYADDLNNQVRELKESKRQFESDEVYKQQRSDLDKLKRELRNLKEKLGIMEKELAKAKHLIETQSRRLTSMDVDRNDMQIKFKEELEKTQRAMRSEIERMREVMKHQYTEMKSMREQNTEMHNDVKDIRDLLLADRTSSKKPVTSSVPSNRSQFASRPMTERSRVPGAPGPHIQGMTRASYPQPSGLQINLPALPRENTNKWVPSGANKRGSNRKS